jgi:hypothetical protein
MTDDFQIHSSLLRWLVQTILTELGVECIDCIDEVDSVIVRDARSDSSVFGIVSNDSDFYVCQGIRFLPFYNFEMLENECNVRVYSSSIVAQLLGLSHEEALIDLSIICGNDYTKPFNFHSLYCSEMHFTFDCVLNFISERCQQQQQQALTTYNSCTQSPLFQSILPNSNAYIAIAETIAFASIKPATFEAILMNDVGKNIFSFLEYLFYLFSLFL